MESLVLTKEGQDIEIRVQIVEFETYEIFQVKSGA